MKIRSRDDGSKYPLTPSGPDKRTFDKERAENGARERKVLTKRRAKAFVGKEAVAPADIDRLVKINQEMMAASGTHFWVHRGELDKIFSGLDQYRKISDKRERLMNMAAWIAYAMADRRPFNNGNKRTAAIATVKFLNANGYDLLLELLDLQTQFHRLLRGVQHGTADSGDILKFLKKNARHL